MPDEVYDLLATTDKHGLHWFCGDCEKITLDHTPYAQEVLSVLGSLLEQWSRTESTMLQKVNSLETTMLEKVDGLESKLVTPQLTNKLSHLEEKILKQSEELQELRNMMKKELDRSNTRDNIIAMDEKVTKLVATVERNQSDNHDLRDCVQDAVREKLQEDKEEIEDIKRRSTNVVIHGLPEVAGEDVVARKKAEEDQLVDLLHAVRCDDVSVQSLARLGVHDSSSGKPRSVKVVLASQQQQEKVLSQAKNLFGNATFGKVFIQQDLTIKQRLKRRELVQQLKQRRANGEDNLMIISDRIVTRKRRLLQEATN